MKEIKQLLAITKSLRENYGTHGRNFTLDGKLVGDIGEVLCAEKYGLDLLGENAQVHDAIERCTGRKIQIKSSFKNYSYFPFGADKMPDYFLSINITNDGEIEELYNGPGEFVYKNYILKSPLKPYNETFYTLSKGKLAELNERVPPHQKIKPVK